MRVLLGVAWYFPDSVGGTEVYVRGLARHLRRAGVDVSIAAPATEGQLASVYEHEDVPVYRYAVSRAGGALALDRPEPREWSEIIDRVKPEIVDLHSLTPDLELAHLKAARRRKAHGVVTVHLPGLICARGTFMKFGRTPCDGDLARQPCTACRLEARGLPRAAAWLLSKVPASLSVSAKGNGRSGWFSRTLAAPASQDTRRRWIAEVMAETDRVVAVSRWLGDAIVRNGVPREKVVVCPQGIESESRSTNPARIHSNALRVGFVGRYDVVKGLHVLIDAAHKIPENVAMEFHVWAPARTPEARAYEAVMKTRARGNARIVFHGETADSSTAYAAIDVLAVPSTWFETGPFVVLEAQAAGLPIVGSNIGGIPERVTHGRDGWLVPPGDVSALADALVFLARNPAKLEALRYRGRPRTMAEVGEETLATYRQILAVASA